jgi:hypothetical protein
LVRHGCPRSGAKMLATLDKVMAENAKRVKLKPLIPGQ